MFCQDIIYIIDNIKIIDKTIVKNHLPFRSEKSKQHHSHKNNFFFFKHTCFHFQETLQNYTASIQLLCYPRLFPCLRKNLSMCRLFIFWPN